MILKKCIGSMFLLAGGKPDNILTCFYVVTHDVSWVGGWGVGGVGGSVHVHVHLRHTGCILGWRVGSSATLKVSSLALLWHLRLR